MSTGRPKRKISVDKFFQSLIFNNYFHRIKSHPKLECLRSVTLHVFNITSEKSLQNNRFSAMVKKLELFCLNNEKEIEHYFNTLYNGPNLDFPKNFKLDFKYLDIFNFDNVFNNNLRNNIFEKFSKINSVCISSEISEYQRVNDPLVVINFKCTFKNFPATYKLNFKNSSIDKNCILIFTVVQEGPMLHQKGVTKSTFINKDHTLRNR